MACLPLATAPRSLRSGPGCQRRQRRRRWPSTLLLLVVANSATFFSNLESLLRSEAALESELPSSSPPPSLLGIGGVRSSAPSSHTVPSSWHLSGARELAALLPAAALPSRTFPARNDSEAAVVVAAGPKPAEQDRIRQLVGSLQHWHPELSILIYAVGRRGEARFAAVRFWKNVRMVTAAQVRRDICAAGSPGAISAISGLVPSWLAIKACTNQSLELSSSSSPPLLLLHALLGHSSAIFIEKGVVLDGWMDHLLKAVNYDGFAAIEDDKGYCRPTVYGLNRASPAIDKLLKPQLYNALGHASSSGRSEKEWQDWLGVRPRRSQGNRCLPRRSIQLSSEASSEAGGGKWYKYFCRLQYEPLAHVVSESPIATVVVADHEAMADLTAIGIVVDSKTTSLGEFHSLFWAALLNGVKEEHQQEVCITVIVGVIGSRASSTWALGDVEALDWAGGLSTTNTQSRIRLVIYDFPEGIDKSIVYNFAFEKAMVLEASFFLAWDCSLCVYPSLRQKGLSWLSSMQDSLRSSPRRSFFGVTTLEREGGASEFNRPPLFHMVHTSTHFDIFKSMFPYNIPGGMEAEWISSVYGMQGAVVANTRAVLRRILNQDSAGSRCNDVQSIAIPILQQKDSDAVEQWLGERAHSAGDPIWKRVTFVDEEENKD